MIEPVELQRITLAALSAGGVVLFGACYAVLYALGRLRGLSKFRLGAYYAYLALIATTLLLAFALNLNGAWFALVIVLLVGYFVAPRMIWALSTEIHEPSQDAPVPRAPPSGANIERSQP